MAADGLNFACTNCHVTKDHVWAGSRYQMVARDREGTGNPGERRDVATCESCHGDKPHAKDSVAALKLNDHTASVACQTCHIPAMARGGVATKVDWDWRTAGKTRNGEGYKVEDYVQGNGAPPGHLQVHQGELHLRREPDPEYLWFDGAMRYTTVDTRFDADAQPVEINGFRGSREDRDSRIWPFKRMHTWQPFDVGNGTLVYTHLWGDDDDAFWGNYDMAKAVEHGMKESACRTAGNSASWRPCPGGPSPIWSPRKRTPWGAPTAMRKGGVSQPSKGSTCRGATAAAGSIPRLLLVVGTLAGVVGHGLIRKLATRRCSTDEHAPRHDLHAASSVSGTGRRWP